MFIFLIISTKSVPIFYGSPSVNFLAGYYIFLQITSPISLPFEIECSFSDLSTWRSPWVQDINGFIHGLRAWSSISQSSFWANMLTTYTRHKPGKTMAYIYIPDKITEIKVTNARRQPPVKPKFVSFSVYSLRYREVY